MQRDTRYPYKSKFKKEVKVLGTLRYEKRSKEWFSVQFDDGIILMIDRVGEDKWESANMISVGIDSYYLSKKKWPKGQNLKKRIDLGVALIKKNINNNRYRIKKSTTKK